ncbi:MAG TPA: CopG family transcriptional regulator [Candidatus Aminicenantes bacterium]|nr:CopG family transcriptional regulator [Candidatus Aminicenantes bacterium]
MERQNITLSLPKDLLQKAKILAVKKNKSLSGLLSEYIAMMTKEEEAYQAAKTRHHRILKKGFDLGLRGEIPWKREQLHER